jgi:hypothetical protein
MARTARTSSRKRGTGCTGREAYEPDPEPSSSKDEDETNKEIYDLQGPGSAEEELEADAASDAWSATVMPEVRAHDGVVEYYHYTLGFIRDVAKSLYMDQGLFESQHLIGIGDRNSVDRVCKYDHITVSIQASQRLSMLVYYLRHQERISRVIPRLTAVLICSYA